MLNNVLTIFSNRVLTAILGIAITFVTAKCLSPENFGILSVVVAATAMLTRLLSLGVAQGVQYYGAIGKNGNEFVVGGVFWSIVIIVIFSCLFVGLVGDYVSVWMMPHRGDYHELFNFFVNFLPFLILQLMISVFFFGARELDSYRAISIIPLFLCFLVVSLACAFDDPRSVILWGYALQYASGGVLALYLLIKKGAFELRMTGDSLRRVVDIYKYGLKSYVISVVSFSSGRIGLIIAAWYVAASDLAILSIARTLGEAVVLMYGALGPLLMSYTAGKTKEFSQELLGLSCRLSLIVFVIISFFIVFLAQLVVPMLLGDHYSFVPVLVAVVLPGVVINTQQRMLENYLYGRDKHFSLVYSHILSLAFLAVITSFMANFYGVVGVAVAGVAGQLMLFFLTGVVAFRVDQLNPSQYLVPRKSDFRKVYFFFKEKLYRMINKEM